MEIGKRAVVELVRSVGRQDDAARAETELPDPVDTERDAELLTRVGLDPETMRGHLRPEGAAGPSTDVGPAGGASTGRLLGKPTTAQREYAAEESQVPPTAGRGGGDAGTSDASSGEPGLPGGSIGGEAGAGGEGPTLTGGAEEGAGFGSGPAGGARSGA
jgi:hypothetical protein